jgi:beta-glucosidase/6-phospho-beta-glucosidase/beta-galactosidase
VGSGFGLDFRSDLSLLADLGLSSIRLTLDWARLEPHSGRWDSDATDHFVQILEAARTAGIDVWAGFPSLIRTPLPPRDSSSARSRRR